MFPFTPPTDQLQRWLGQFNQRTLKPHMIEQHLRNVAVSFIQVEPNQDSEPESPGPSTTAGNASSNERRIKEATVELLESFICGEDSEQFLEQLKQNDSNSSVCGRVFKIGEPTYSCRECSMDPTCVLCSSCFKKSTHRTHKYKMATSCGGGCCDCGDIEAWKKDPFCEEHNTISVQNLSKEPTTQLPGGVKKRCGMVFNAVLSYCMRVLQMDGDGNFSELEDEENTHCTVLYNDETHTFEQVIQALTSIVRCSQKTAIEYVTSIDREGRAVVKCASFEVCKKLKEDIETKAIRTSVGGRASPLKVTVMHRHEVACQNLAMQLLGWFQEFLSKHSSFRNIFAEQISQTDATFNVKQILGNDHQLWKSARSCWHRLLISGMLMEYKNKKSFALWFMAQYSLLMQAFIRDDHYHSFSIVSLSVQLFTVPTIAHHLIEHESGFFKLIHTFYAEGIERYIKNRQLQFAKNTSSLNVFKRAAYILVDLKYLLNFKPYAWTNGLRSGFLHGAQVLIRLLSTMQGMDAVARQIGQHMEFEPEWETAFTLHLKLSHLITLVLDWCSSDRVVLVKVYRMVLVALTESKFIVQETEPVLCEVANHEAYCLSYDVSSKAVSVHLPLTRFLAGLYTQLDKYGLTIDTIAPTVPDQPTPTQIIEPVLCTRTMISQVHAGLWRRNGYALLNQLYFYRNVKCRYEMLDRDIVILQIGASLIDANEFIIHVLNKFNLLHWLSSDQIVNPTRTADPAAIEDDYLRQTTILVEELLELLIVVVGERYVPCVGDILETDRIKKEIVQQLCIKPHSHSELSRALNEDNCNETAIESVIKDVAVFEKPNAADKKGVFKLKPEYYSWYNLYFYHYSKEEKSKSEEAQRNRRKEKGELVCCPPPELPKLAESFRMLPNLLQCDVMLEIVRTILTRALDLKSSSFSEGQLQRILHLIGYAILEEETGHYPYLKFIERSQKINLLALLNELAKSQRVESQRDLLRWVIQRYKAFEAKTKKPQKASVAEEKLAVAEGGESSQAGACGGGGSSGSSQQQLDTERLEKEQRAKMAAIRRAELLAQMRNAQQNFMNSHAALFESVEEDVNAGAGPSSAGVEDGAGTMDMEWQSEATSAGARKSPICLGPNRQPARWQVESGGVGVAPATQRHTCILCSESSVLTVRNGSCMVYAAFVQRSSVLSRFQQTDERGQLQYIETVIHPSPHISTCGHVMHTVCFEKYFTNEVIKEHRRPSRNRTPVLFDIEKRQFLCPLCRCLSNCLLPLMPPLEGIVLPDVAVDSVTASDGSSGVAIVGSVQTTNFDFRSWYAFMQNFLSLMQNQTASHSRSGPWSADFASDPLAEPADEGMQDVEEGEDNLSSSAVDVRAQNDADVELLLRQPLHVIVLDMLDSLYPRLQLRVRAAQPDAESESTGDGSTDVFDSYLQANLQKFCLVVGEHTSITPKAKQFADYLAAWLACSYTIKSLEMLLRVMERPFGAELSIRHESCLRGLVRASCVLGAIMPGQTFHRSMVGYAIDLYETLFGLKSSNSFFEWDLFAILNTCLFSTRYVLFQAVPAERIPRGDGLDQAIMHAVFLCNMLRTIVTSTAGSEEESGPYATMNLPDADGDAEMDTHGPEAGEADDQGELSAAERNLLRMYHIYNIFRTPTDIEERVCLVKQRQGEPAGQDNDVVVVEDDDDDDVVVVEPDDDVVVVDDDDDDVVELVEHDEDVVLVKVENYQVDYQDNYVNLADEGEAMQMPPLKLIKIEQEEEKPRQRLARQAKERRLCRALLRDIRTQGHTLLRCCCLLFHSITDVELPQGRGPGDEGKTDDTDYQLMVTYLGLPADPLAHFTPDGPSSELMERLAGANAKNIFEMRWVRQEQLFGGRPAFQFGPPVRQLIDLPEDYSDLINSVSLFTCPNNIRDDSRNPTMCLVCGEILCSQSFCCQKELDNVLVGSCTYHTAECGAGIGIFLRIRDAEILLLGMNKGCFIPAPYLDEYGETDQGLRRGNPLRLCKERYRKLHLIWLSHGLHEEITRRNESQQTIFATQWQNL